MRSRPTIKLLLSPTILTPGTRLIAEALVVAKTETPIDFVAVLLRCHVFATSDGDSTRLELDSALYHREWQSAPGKLTPGEHRYRVAFDLPEHLPPSYSGSAIHIDYTIQIHVAIPWWRDKIEVFNVPVGPRESHEAPAPNPQSFATSADGPRGTKLFMEVALESTRVMVGDVLLGSVSLQNTRNRTIRAVEASIVEIETVGFSNAAPREGKRHTVTLHQGQPKDGEPMPLAIQLPASGTPSFRSGAMQVTTHLEVRAIVAWGEDVVVRPPLEVLPKGATPRTKPGQVAPVGRERRAIVWQGAAMRHGLTSDPDTESMVGSRGDVTIEIRAEVRDEDSWFVATLGFETLGLDLQIAEKKWTDALALGLAAMKSGDEESDARFAFRAREHAQASVVVTSPLVRALLPFEDVKVEDQSATLASRGAPHASAPVEDFVTAVMRAAEALDAARGRVPAPLLFRSGSDVVVLAWRAFAERLRGRLELGRMCIHDGVVGTDRITLATAWTRAAAVSGTIIQVVIDPPLDAAATSPDDPAISPAARAAWRELEGRAKAVRVAATLVELDLDGMLRDPADALPTIELAVSLRRALSGLRGAGPFR